MTTTYYVATNGDADSILDLYTGQHGVWRIDIAARGTTRDNVDWQYVGVMYCQNRHTGEHRTLGLIWDDARILTDVEGETFLTPSELSALRHAGFNVAAWMPACQRSSITPPFLDDVDEAEGAEDFDAVSFIMDYEGGALDEDEIIAGFQHMLDTGIVWQLQGSYGRTAAALLDAGLIERR